MKLLTKYAGRVRRSEPTVPAKIEALQCPSTKSSPSISNKNVLNDKKDSITNIATAMPSTEPTHNEADVNLESKFNRVEDDNAEVSTKLANTKQEADKNDSVSPGKNNLDIYTIKKASS